MGKLPIILWGSHMKLLHLKLNLG